MLSFKIGFSDKSVVCLPNPISIVYNSEYSVPADDIVVCFPFVKNLDSADYLFVYEDSNEGEKILFKGIVDEIITLKNDKGFFTKIVARNMAGILLDNEAEPNVYFNVSASVIFKKHLKPYGFDDFFGDDLPLYNKYFTVAKGCSEWNVIENFCKAKYEKSPRITSSGKVIFDTKYNEKFVFSDVCENVNENENKYYSIKKLVNKSKAISEIKVKLLENKGYESTIYNKAIENKVIDTKILKRRFVDVTRENITINTVDNMMKNSNNKCFEIVIECLGAFMDCVGEGACVLDSLIGKYDDLYIHKVKYICDDSGDRSVISLRRW